MRIRCLQIWLLSILALGCGGSISDSDVTSGGSGSGKGGKNGGSDGAGSGGSNGGGSTALPPLCDAEEARPESAPIRRLTPTNYNRSIRDLFDGLTVPEQTIAADPVVDGFDNNAAGQSPSPLLIEQYRNAAIAVAEAAVTDLGDWAPCDSSGGSGCAEDIAHMLAERAFRRPLTMQERIDVGELANSSFSDFGFEIAVRLTIEGILQTPQFLYRPEFGRPDDEENGLIPLTGYEIATRLSYFLWQTMPDQELLDAAEAGDLDTADGVEAQAMRLLEDDRAKQAVAEFHAQWFRLDRLRQYLPDPSMYEMYTEPVREAVIASTERFLDYAFWEAGTVEALYTDHTVFINDAMAEVYGVSPPGSDELVPVEFPDDERAGILTQPGLLASTSHERQHAPILRGVFVRSAVLCSPMPPPPPTVNAVLTEPTADRPRTTREHIEETHVKSECAGCHNAIDGIGFAFENYDAIGRFVTEENDLPVDPTGELVGIAGIDDGKVDNAVDLADLIANTQQTSDCVASQWFRYALGRTDNDDGSVCQVRRLGASLSGDGAGDMKAMLLELIRSDSFRFNPAL